MSQIQSVFSSCLSATRRQWIHVFPQWNFILVSLIALSMATEELQQQKCSGGLKYTWGDALVDSPDCIGPNGSPYPMGAVSRTFRSPSSSSSPWGLPNGSSYRMGRARQTGAALDPSVTQKALLKAHRISNGIESLLTQYTVRDGRASSLGMNIKKSEPSCGSTPARLCKTRYNTTAPMYGVSLTSGQPVTIVQKFPDLLQQVVFEVCESNECDVVRGECTQTYVPYLFLVIPLGPVTLTGQDYVLVESGCVCRPKYASTVSEPSAISAIPNL
ncbi:uncharacterized protein [Hetaerina americana]|uniref:uncharacterized protein n=1 Tax=Hetaerina americana TaxID=62018 RepID=UPI003A7F5DB2